MKQYFREIPEDVVNTIEKANYEYETLKDNVAFLLDQHQNDPDFLASDIFNRYQNAEVTAKMQYERLKKEFEKKFVPKEFSGHQISWSLEYNTKVLTITKMCDCEVELCGDTLNNFRIA